MVKVIFYFLIVRTVARSIIGSNQAKIRKPLGRDFIKGSQMKTQRLMP